MDSLSTEHVVPKNGRGGYTVVACEREDGKWNVTICQCKPSQRYNKEIGERTAINRYKQGMRFVRTIEELAELLTTLRNKVNA